MPKRISSLVWDAWNKKHIQKHNVTKKEVEYVHSHQLRVVQAKKRTLRDYRETEKRKNDNSVSLV